MPAELIGGRVRGLAVDVEALTSYYREIVEPAPATQYHDNDAPKEFPVSLAHQNADERARDLTSQHQSGIDRHECNHGQQQPSM